MRGGSEGSTTATRRERVLFPLQKSCGLCDPRPALSVAIEGCLTFSISKFVKDRAKCDEEGARRRVYERSRVMSLLRRKIAIPRTADRDLWRAKANKALREMSCFGGQRRECCWEGEMGNSYRPSRLSRSLGLGLWMRRSKQGAVVRAFLRSTQYAHFSPSFFIPTALVLRTRFSSTSERQTNGFEYVAVSYNSRSRLRFQTLFLSFLLAP